MDILTWLLPAIGGWLTCAVVPWPAKAAWSWLRGGASAKAAQQMTETARLASQLADRDDLVDLLRKALDKHLIRESAVASACELLIALVHMVDIPTPAMLRMRDRALEVLEDARAHIGGINKGGLQ